jgi:hypothetical protein
VEHIKQFFHMSPKIFDGKSIWENTSCSHKYRKVHRSVQNSPPLVPILRQINSVLYLKHCKSHFNIIQKSLSMYTKGFFFRSGFSDEGFYGFCSPSLALCVLPILISPISLPQIRQYLPKTMSYDAPSSENFPKLPLLPVLSLKYSVQFFCWKTPCAFFRV